MAKTEPKYVKSSIDEIDNINARHFTQLGKDKAVKELLVTFGPETEAKKDAAWASKAFDVMAKDVAEADKKEEEEKKK